LNIYGSYKIEKMKIDETSKLNESVEKFIRKILRDKRIPEYQKTAIVEGTSLRYFFEYPSVCTFSNSLIVPFPITPQILSSISYQGIFEHEAYHLRQRKIRMSIALGVVPLTHILLTAMHYITSDITNDFFSLFIVTFSEIHLIAIFLQLLYIRHEEHGADNYIEENPEILSAFKAFLQEAKEKTEASETNKWLRIIHDNAPRIYWLIKDRFHPSPITRIKNLEKRIAKL